MRPYLLLDVDGVLCPFAESPGYRFASDLDVWLSEANRDHLATLKGHFDLVWATLWEDKANEFLLDHHGLDPLPVIKFSGNYPLNVDTYKLTDISAWSADKPFAWIDDDIRQDAMDWAGDREIPTLFVRTDPMVGMTQEHVDKLVDFAEGLNGTTSNDS